MTIVDFMRLMYDTLDNPDKAYAVLDEFACRKLLAGEIDPGVFREFESENFDMYTFYVTGGEYL